MSKGKLITIYGINNVGKSTQAKLLVEKLELEGHQVKFLKYPIYDLAPTGPFLNSVLRGEGGQKISEDELQLWFILNRYQFEPELKKYLHDGYTVVAEDYVGTGIAWGTAKGLPQEWLEEANKFLLKEDLSIFIDGERDPRVIEKIHLHEQNPELMIKCADVLKNMSKKFHWKVVERKKTIEETAGEILRVVKEFLQKWKFDD